MLHSCWWARAQGSWIIFVMPLKAICIELQHYCFHSIGRRNLLDKTQHLKFQALYFTPSGWDIKWKVGICWLIVVSTMFCFFGHRKSLFLSFFSTYNTYSSLPKENTLKFSSQQSIGLKTQYFLMAYRLVQMWVISSPLLTHMHIYEWQRDKITAPDTHIQTGREWVTNSNAYYDNPKILLG